MSDQKTIEGDAGEWPRNHPMNTPARRAYEEQIKREGIFHPEPPPEDAATGDEFAGASAFGDTAGGATVRGEVATDNGEEKKR